MRFTKLFIFVEHPWMLYLISANNIYHALFWSFLACIMTISLFNGENGITRNLAIVFAVFALDKVVGLMFVIKVVDSEILLIWGVVQTTLLSVFMSLVIIQYIKTAFPVIKKKIKDSYGDSL